MKTYNIKKKADILDTAMDLIEQRFDAIEDNEWSMTGPVSRNGFLTQKVEDYLQFEISNGGTSIAMISLYTSSDKQKELSGSSNEFPISYDIRPSETLLDNGDLELYNQFVTAWTSVNNLKKVS